MFMKNKVDGRTGISWETWNLMLIFVDINNKEHEEKATELSVASIKVGLHINSGNYFMLHVMRFATLVDWQMHELC